MDPKDIDVIKVQEIFYRLLTDKTDEFDAYRKNVLSFFLTYLKNTTLNVTPDQLQSLFKERPEIKCGLVYKHSKVYRLLVIVSDDQILFGKFCDKEDRLVTRNKFQRFWSAFIRPLWSILQMKYSTQAHWFTQLEC